LQIKTFGKIPKIGWKCIMRGH